MTRTPKYDFIGKLKIPVMISLCIFLIGFTMNAIWGLDLDINFKGGVMLSYSYKGDVDKAKVNSIVSDILNEKIVVSESSDFAGTQKNIVINLATNDSLSNEKQKEILTTLVKEFPENSITLSNSNSVSPTVGKKFFFKSLFTILLAAFFVTLYVGFRFRKIGGFSAAAAALIALFHDMIIVYLCFVILPITMDENFIAVILTILGYSLNDTIVIYDRIREDRKKLGTKVPLGELVNASINKTLGRTINTSVATFVAVIAVTIVAYLRGLDSIISFTLPMSIGIISGSYSSIFLAGPLWVKWNDYKERRNEKKKLLRKANKA